MKKTILWFTHRILSRLFLRVFVGVRFDSGDFLSKEKQFIIVANHNSHLDTMTIMASLPRNVLHKVRPVAAADHFGKTKLKAKLSNFFINALFPIAYCVIVIFGLCGYQALSLNRKDFVSALKARA